MCADSPVCILRCDFFPDISRGGARSLHVSLVNCRHSSAHPTTEQSSKQHADIDLGDAVEVPSQADHVAFGRLTASNGSDIVAYDGQPSKGYDPDQTRSTSSSRAPTPARSRCLARPRCAGAKRAYPACAGRLRASYGMLTDRYGVTWIVGLDAPTHLPHVGRATCVIHA